MNASGLKYIAYGSMLCDHAAAFLLEPYLTGIGADAQADPLYVFLRTLGRPAFFLFAFFVAEGMRHTKSRMHYLMRLFFLAIVSEIPFDLCRKHMVCDSSLQNTILTLFLGGLLIAVWDRLESLRKRSLPLMYLVRAVVIAVFGAFAIALRTDYGFAGVYVILLFRLMYLRTEQFAVRMGFAVMALFFLKPYVEAPMMLMTSFPKEGYLLMMTQVVGLLALWPIERYNGEKGRMPCKILCYLFYPAHLLMFYGLTLLY